MTENRATITQTKTMPTATGAISKGDGPLLRVKDLCLHFRTTKGVVQAVDGVSFELKRKRSVTVLGESGCGKTSLARAILRLLPRNVHKYTGEVYLNGTDVMKLREEWFRQQVRWVKASMVSQAAMNALNPVLRVGYQVAEPLMVHLQMSKKEALSRAAEVFRIVGVPEDFLHRYAFELSGGMRQRAILAMSLITNPDLIVLDEPTSALDMLTQANIFNALKDIKRQLDVGFILITHDISTSSDLADEVLVMYAGQLVEHSLSTTGYVAPLHPYAQALMSSVPTLRQDKKLEFIPGQPPSLINPPTGCRFAARCPHRFDRCDQEPPTFVVGEHQERVKCWLHAKN
jgi:oligopeptide/dipeptide ABC transporter ATP-binding protein